MTRRLIFFTILIFLTTGCGVLIGDIPCCGSATTTPAPALPPRPTLPAKPSVVPPPMETRAALPTPAPKVIASPPSAGAANTYWVTNPTTNAKLYVQIFAPQEYRRPDGTSQQKYPALVLVPGGIGDGRAFADDATRMASAGIVAITFDPDGRGKSEGKEDYDGYKHQDGLAAVIRFAATLPNVDASKIGVATYSYGITMGSGALARYLDLPVKFLMDWEGPANRHYTTTGCGTNRPGGIQWQPCSDNAWWSEREAVNFIGKLRIPYQRIQSEKDHVQPNNAHAIDMINAAVQGGVPWVRLNDYPPNQTYNLKSPPAMSDDRRIRETMLKIYAELGAQMLVAYHEQGTSLTNPFVFEQGLLQRPSDFSITRVKTENGKENFWWNLIFTPRGDEVNPTKLLQTELGRWNAPRAPFVTALIHEDNFYRSGTPWRTFFFDANDQPLTPPYNLNAPDDSRARTAQQTETIFKTYEEFVAYAAKHLCVVTSADIVALAKGQR